ncbi:tyrosine-protein phosphatase [Acidithrix ferrooxidans]|uniref:Tyrosine specific protein phosphatases domain-containing protein n=1 Tax=Acidithrix ferrooxidans TaxID=1280514 RepID=A0A0D8HL71_9ACTN|nr:tyrosine-protein phosphatase [Acidithrix ferrooxidans]KJF18668.1 hypothetical protein AXFE_04540 [Acidithrix ferrooxidans]
MLEGAFNFRDLGGIKTADGAQIAYGKLFRSDSLQELTASDVEVVSNELKVRCIVDLRSTREAVTEGRGLLGRIPLCYINLPLIDVDSPHGDPGELTVNQYLDHLETDENLVLAINLLGSLVQLPTVVHCAAGKDRTGVLVALVLLLLGVPQEAVAHDYLRTTENMDRIVERFKKWPRYAHNMETLPPEIYSCEPKTIEIFFRELNSRYGGAEKWAEQKGVSSDAIEQLKINLLG